MENIIYLGLFAFVVVLIAIINSKATEKRKVFKNNTYSYSVKNQPMTPTEAEFFRKLQRSVADRYLVFPQMHLSAILDHHVKGQDWKYALSHINGKSVDYLLCDKVSLRPTYAIELDDLSHERTDRRERDAEVERIFNEAELPLVRFKDKTVTESEIIKALQAVWKSRS